MGPVLTPGSLFEQTWYRSTKRPNIKALHLFSFRKEFGSFSSSLLCLNLWCPGQGQFKPQGLYFKNLVEILKEIQHTKYQSSISSSFSEEFWSFPSLFLWSKLWTPGQGQLFIQSPSLVLVKPRTDINNVSCYHDITEILLIAA